MPAATGPALSRSTRSTFPLAGATTGMYLALFEEPQESDEEAPAQPSRARPQSRG